MGGVEGGGELGWGRESSRTIKERTEFLFYKLKSDIARCILYAKQALMNSLSTCR